MSYPHQSALAAARRRRHRRAIATLTFVVLLLVGGFGYSLAYYQGWIGKDGRANAAPTSPSPSCSVGPSGSSGRGGRAAGEGVLAPERITVNVYNATKRSGLAGSAAAELGQHGFDVGAVANDPLNVEVRGVGQIRYGVDGKAQAVFVRHWLKGAHLVLDGRTGTSVDLVIGDNYKALTPPPEAERTAGPVC